MCTLKKKESPRRYFSTIYIYRRSFEARSCARELRDSPFSIKVFWLFYVYAGRKISLVADCTVKGWWKADWRGIKTHCERFFGIEKQKGALSILLHERSAHISPFSIGFVCDYVSTLMTFLCSLSAKLDGEACVGIFITVWSFVTLLLRADNKKYIKPVIRHNSYKLLYWL